MTAWWIALTIFEKIFVCIAIPSSVLLVIQLVLMIFGVGDGEADGDFGDASGGTPGDMSAELDLDVDGDGIADVASGGGFHLFSFRGIVAFLAVMGWVGYTLIGFGVKFAVSLILALISGFIVMVLIALAFYFFAKLQANGNVSIRNAIGKSGTVYLTIHEKRQGAGKVNIVVSERLCEYDAVTDEDTPIKYGEEILVVGVSGQNTLVVKRK